MMSKLMTAFFAFCLVFAPGLSQAAPQIGETAPSFTAKTADGETVSLEDYRGKTVVLEWTNHECPYVIKHYETNSMQEAQKKATEDGVVWLSIVSSAPGNQGFTSPQEALKVHQDVGAASTERLLDPTGELGQLYEAKTTPHMFVIDADGKLAYKGAIDSDTSASPSAVAGATNYVLAALDALKAGQPVDPASTKPYGCSVKYAY